MNLLLFQTAYTFRNTVDRKLESYFTSKDLCEIFDSIRVIHLTAPFQNAQIANRILPTEDRLTEKIVFSEPCLLNKHYIKSVSYVFSVSTLLFRIWRISKVKNFNLVYADDVSINGILGYVFSRLLGLRLVVGIWGNPQRIRKENGRALAPKLFRTPRVEAAIERFVLKRSSIVFVQNQENALYPLSLGLSKNVVKVAPLGIGLHPVHHKQPNHSQVFSPVGCSNMLKTTIKNQKQIRFACVSRLESTKMVGHVLEALALASTSIGHSWTLTIVGDGPERGRLLKVCQRLGIESRVNFLGVKDQEFIAKLYRNSHFAILPLAGRALLEAGLGGCPVITYDLDWHSEIVINGITGYLAPKNSPKELSQSIVKAVSGLGDSQQMRQSIRKRSLELCNVEYAIWEQGFIYRSLIQ